MSKRNSSYIYTDASVLSQNKENISHDSNDKNHVNELNSFENSNQKTYRHSSMSGISGLKEENVFLSPLVGSHPQKRVFTSASNNSYHDNRRVSSNGSTKSTQAERMSKNNYFTNEGYLKISSTITTASPQYQNDHQRKSSNFSVEETDYKQTSQFKPFYAQQQQEQVREATRIMTQQQQRHSHHATNTSKALFMNDQNSEEPYQNLFNKSSSVSSAPLRSSMRKQPNFGPYILGKTIGEGEFGKVKLAWSTNKKNKDTFNYHLSSSAGPISTISNKLTGNIDTEDMPKQVAIKLIKNSSIPEGSETETKLFREINSLRVLTHPNIVRLEEVIRNDTHIGIVMEYASGGEFYKYIQEKKRLKENEGCRLFAQLISGVQYMHSKGMAHRDLKLENLLLDRFENLIITDFGFVNEFLPGKNELMKTSCGSPCYAAPELVVSSRPYSARKADLWSCGIILFAILAGYLPWDDDSNNPDGDDIAKLYMYITQTSLKFPEYISPVPRDLLRRILVPNPKHRLTMEQVYQHQWMIAHRPFLSISTDEWDRFLSIDNNKVYRSKQTQNTRPVRPRSSFSASGEKRSSLILENSFSAKALPPKESHTVATIKNDKLPAAIAVQNMNYHNKKNRHESIDFSQLNNFDRDFQPNHVNFEKPLPIIDNNNKELFASNNPSEISISESPIGFLMSPKNNIPVSYHKRNNSAASVVLQQVIDESDQQQQHKFQPYKPRKARPMSYHPGSANSYGFNLGEDTEQFAFKTSDQQYNKFTDNNANIRTKKHNSIIHEEDGPEFESYKLNRFNQIPIDNDGHNRSNIMNGRIRDISETSSSTIGTPTRNSSSNSRYYYSDQMTESNQHTRVPSQGTQINVNTAASTKKSKRFSLLSFYSLYDGSNSKTQISSHGNNSATSLGANGNTTSNNTQILNTDSSSKQGLQQKIFNSENSSKINRKTRSPFIEAEFGSNNSNSLFETPTKQHISNSSANNQASGNSSTTRKVLDFFKRRSIRL
ncbi:hypothetical protein QEN19_001519 [Hanseniaspora menglaensis]